MQQLKTSNLHYIRCLKPNSNNLQVRLEYLFGEYGFFNFTIMEVENKSLFNDTTDFSFWHRNRRYIIQEFIRDGFNNPTHHSFKVPLGLSIDFDNPDTILHFIDRLGQREKINLEN